MNYALMILFISLGHITVWIQLYYFPHIGEQLGIWKNWVLYLASIPIAWFMITGTQFGIEAFGTNWPVRISTFIIGNLVFFVLTTLYLNEHITLKSITSLLLTVIVLLIQIFWKE